MFLKVDCGGISESLTESELFGYMPGAFTGAGNKGKSGYFEMADGGTVFLDEVGELSLAMQTRLLRVLQDGEIMRVGSSKPRKVDVRIIAATSRQSWPSAWKRGFSGAISHYRLNVAVVNIPPLRERPDDIEPLIHAFSQRLYHQVPQAHEPCARPDGGPAAVFMAGQRARAAKPDAQHRHHQGSRPAHGQGPPPPHDGH